MARRRIGWFFLGTGLVGALAMLAAREFLTGFASGSVQIEADHRIVGYLGIASAIAAGGIVMYPIAAVVLVGAAVYGPTVAVATYPGTLVGALLGWWVGRRMGKDALRRYPGEAVRKLLDLVERRALLSAALVRWVPGLPFALQNAGLGAARVPLTPFLLGTLVGIVPAQATMIVGGVSARGLLQQIQGSVTLGWIGVGVTFAVGLALILTARPTAPNPPDASTTSQGGRHD